MTFFTRQVKRGIYKDFQFNLLWRKEKIMKSEMSTDLSLYFVAGGRHLHFLNFWIHAKMQCNEENKPPKCLCLSSSILLFTTTIILLFPLAYREPYWWRVLRELTSNYRLTRNCVYRLQSLMRRVPVNQLVLCVAKILFVAVHPTRI